MIDIVEPQVEALIDVEAFTPLTGARASGREVVGELHHDLLAEVMSECEAVYRRPRGYPPRPLSGAVETGTGQRSH